MSLSKIFTKIITAINITAGYKNVHLLLRLFCALVSLQKIIVFFFSDFNYKISKVRWT